MKPLFFSATLKSNNPSTTEKMKDLASTKNRFSIPYCTGQPPKGFATAPPPPTPCLTWLKSQRDASFPKKTLLVEEPLFLGTLDFDIFFLISKRKFIKTQKAIKYTGSIQELPLRRRIKQYKKIIKTYH
jgi:hypothetical protein